MIRRLNKTVLAGVWAEVPCARPIIDGVTCAYLSLFCLESPVAADILSWCPMIVGRRGVDCRRDDRVCGDGISLHKGSG